MNQLLLRENLDELLQVLRTAEEVFQHPMSFAQTRQEQGTVAGFPTSMVPFPDPIRTSGTDRQVSSSSNKAQTSNFMYSSLQWPFLPTSFSFVKQLHKQHMTRKVTPIDGCTAPPQTVQSYPSSLRHETPTLSSNSQSFSMDQSKEQQDNWDELSDEDLFADDIFADHEQDDGLFMESSVVPSNCSSDQGPTSNISAILDTVNTSSSSLKPTSTKARPHRYQSGPWNQRLEELRQFYQEHGHLLVPHVYKKSPRLSQWVKRQRYQHRLKQMGRHSTLSDDRELILNKIGFVWESHKQSWNDSFQSLQVFYMTRGHCRVTKSNADETLNTWCKHQRRQYKRFVCGQSSHMTMERIQKLESLQFDWDPRNILALAPTTIR